jgi:hypothetical protein
MAQDDRIDEIRTELEAARWDVFCSLDDVSRQLDLGARIRQSIRTEPWRWVAAIALTGLVAGKLVPLLFRRSARGWASQLGSQVARNAVAAAVPVLAAMAGEALERRRQRGNPNPARGARTPGAEPFQPDKP